MINVPFLDLKKVNAIVEQDIYHTFNDVLNSGWYILGSKVQVFEEMMAADLYNSQNEPGYVVGCNSGTDAIVLALLAANVGYGDEVITVAHTAIPTVTAIVSVGATPIFVDIDEKTWVMDVSKVSGRISAKTKAIIPVHLYGNMVDVLKLKSILVKCGREDISIIEDVAQAQGSYLKDFQAGTIGNFGAFSFYPSKNIGALGDGGAVACKTESDYLRLRMLRNYGQESRYNASVIKGINSRLDEIQAGILSIKLKYLHKWNEQRARLMENYRKQFTNDCLIFQQVTEHCNPGWHLCVLAFADQYNRDKASTILQENGVQTLIHYPIPIHHQKAFEKCDIGCELKNTENLVKRILSIPFNIVLQENEQNYVINILKKIKKSNLFYT